MNVIHVRSRAPAFSAWIAARLTGCPMVATYHGIYNARSGLKRWYNSIMTRGRMVIANSEFTRRHLIAEHGVAADRVVTIMRGIDLERFSPEQVSAERIESLRARWQVQALADQVTILLAGRLTAWKGQALAIAAVSRLADPVRRRVRLLLVGDDQGRTAYRLDLERQIADAGLGRQVSLVGHCADMPAAYALADLVIAPSTEPEAFGRTAVEPQAMGVPVLASDHGATSETVQAGITGWLVTPGDVDAWSAALAEAVLAGPDRLVQMGQKGQAFVRARYSVEQMCNATLDVYDQVLGRIRVSSAAGSGS